MNIILKRLVAAKAYQDGLIDNIFYFEALKKKRNAQQSLKAAKAAFPTSQKPRPVSKGSA